MPDVEHTWLVECFVPGVDDAAVAEATDRARRVVEGLQGAGQSIAYLGALLMADDEVVFHAFRAADVDLVRAAGEAARLQFERIVESVGVVPGLAGPLEKGAIA